MLEMGNFSNEFFKGTVADEKALEFGKILQEINIELGGVVVANHEIFNSFKFWFAVKITDFFKFKKIITGCHLKFCTACLFNSLCIISEILHFSMAIKRL